MEYHECKRNNKKLLYISTCSTFGIAERHLVVTYVRTLTKSLKCKKKKLRDFKLANISSQPLGKSTIFYDRQRVT